MVRTITWKTKGKAKERPKNVQPAWTRKGRELIRTITWKTKVKAKERLKDMQFVGREGKELILLVVGSYLTHKPFNVVDMQIVKSNNNRRFRTSISHQCNFPFYNKGQRQWKAILTCCLKIWMQKDKDKLSFNYLSWKK